MRKLSLTLLMVLVMLCSVILTGLAADKVLRMYTAFDTEEAKYYIEAFEKETGIEVEWVRMSSGEVLARIEAESANPQASMWHAGSNTSH
ncbi:MAG: iron ABC transporter substrate-binding protein, partial [Candidatus Atribacteria bacterium]|nr:iron ABC transporter substrate-binding protein [Candidatus Atribacteria bacterium]